MSTTKPPAFVDYVPGTNTTWGEALERAGVPPGRLRASIILGETFPEKSAPPLGPFVACPAP